jgi:hypothetical protein
LVWRKHSHAALERLLVLGCSRRRRPLAKRMPSCFLSHKVDFSSNASIIHKKTLITEVNCKITTNNKTEEEEPKQEKGLVHMYII